VELNSSAHYSPGNLAGSFLLRFDLRELAQFASRLVRHCLFENFLPTYGRSARCSEIPLGKVLSALCGYND
jgi:hypothetical protein